MAYYYNSVAVSSLGELNHRSVAGSISSATAFGEAMPITTTLA
jgi:hypothetical protein